jgi:hypothetical protein
MREPDLEAIRRSVLQLGAFSDSLIRIGPFSLGVDGILDWIPGAGEIYSMAAAAFLLVQGARARVPLSILAICAALMGSRAAITAVPLAGPLAADLFTAHKWSARLIAAAISRRMGRRGEPPASAPFGYFGARTSPSA